MPKVTERVSEPKLKLHLSDSRAPSPHRTIVMSRVEALTQTTGLLFDNKSNSAQQPIPRCSAYTASPPESSGPQPIVGITETEAHRCMPLATLLTGLDTWGHWDKREPCSLAHCLTRSADGYLLGQSKSGHTGASYTHQPPGVDTSILQHHFRSGRGRWPAP